MSDPNPTSNLAALRHDLRTPINHILGYSELLAEDLADQGIKNLGDLEKVQIAAKQLLGLIDSRLTDSASPALPESPKPLAEPVPEATIQAPTPTLATLAGRILVVDDHPDNRDVLAKRLQRQGHQTAQAKDGQQALEMLAASPFDLVLLDILMPTMDGTTALGHMKADPALRHIPVIMISALDEIESVVSCIEMGAEDFLPKPFNPTLLRARIGASLEKKAFRDQEQAYLHQIEETQKRLADELQEAARYVTSILPPPMEHPFSIAWAYTPSTELGGDSFGYHWIDSTHFAIYLLDVCGHGVGAALLSVAAINVLRSGSLHETDFRDPGQVLTGLNASFQMEQHNNMYFTIWYGVFDTATRTLHHASGGHPPAILLTPGEDGSNTLSEVRCPGTLIGVMPDISFESESQVIPPNARLFVYCDGAYEIKGPDGKMLDFDTDFLTFLQEHGRSPSLPDDVLAWIHSMNPDPVLDDDYSFITIDFPATS